MRFNPGESIIRFGQSYTIVFVDEASIMLESSVNNQRVMVDMAEFLQNYTDGDTYMEGTMSSHYKQSAYTANERERINFRKPYADVFNQAVVKRSQCEELIASIYSDCKHAVLFPFKKKPSRASCYRWGKLLSDAHGDQGALKNG